MSSTRDVERRARPRAMPGVAGRAQHLGRARRAVQRAHERVLAPAGADDEDLDGSRAPR